MADFPSNAQDTQFYNVTYEHIGEAEAINFDGSCAKTFLIPNKDRTLCILPNRIDVARHYMIYGGIEALRESPKVSFSRLLSFGRYMFDLEKHEAVKKLFESEKFTNAAKQICPKNKQYLDPFQFNFIIQVPGQTVAIHLDAVYFAWATRFHYPQWLLAVMAFSGAYKQDFVDQIQVVAYLHKWKNQDPSGNFVWWTENDDYHVQAPESGAASIVDGSKTVHAATVYRPEERPPIMDKSANNRLIYKGNDEWHLMSNEKFLKTYKTDDLRISIVYRARCFENLKAHDEFMNKLKEEPLPVEKILNDLTNLMAERQKKKIDDFKNLSRLDLAFALLDEFVHYPIRKSGIPYNYCALSKQYPLLAPLLEILCV